METENRVTIVGRIVDVTPIKIVKSKKDETKKWNTLAFVVIDDSFETSNYYEISVFGDEKCDAVMKCKEKNDVVVVEARVKSSRYTRKDGGGFGYFTKIDMIGIMQASSMQPTNQQLDAVASNTTIDDIDDMPF